MGPPQPLVVRINENGDTLWTQRYPSVGIGSADIVKRCNDGGYIVAGNLLQGAVFAIRIDSDTGTNSHTAVPMNLTLFPAYPNPFNSLVNIPFSIDRHAHLKVEVFNMLGEKIATLADDPFDAGDHVLKFVPVGVSSGSYVIVLSSSGTLQSQLLIYAR